MLIQMLYRNYFEGRENWTHITF